MYSAWQADALTRLSYRDLEKTHAISLPADVPEATIIRPIKLQHGKWSIVPVLPRSVSAWKADGRLLSQRCIEILFGCPWRICISPNWIKTGCAAATPRDIREIGGGCWVHTNSLLGLWGIFSTHECKARAYSQLGQNLTFQPQSKLANPRVTWLTARRLSRPPRNFCDTTCSSFPWSMPFVLFCLNYPPLKLGRV